MTDEEAMDARRHEWCCQCRDLVGKFPSVNEASAYAAGFRAGLAHARRWLPLTSDPASWPEEGQFVCVTDALETWSGPNANSDAVWWNPHTNPTQGWTHWLPLPPPPKGESK